MHSAKSIPSFCREEVCNEALDLVLTEKSILCTEYRIKLSTMVDGSMLNFMKTTDVYALFGNLMDNAIESVIKEEDD